MLGSKYKKNNNTDNTEYKSILSIHDGVCIIDTGHFSEIVLHGYYLLRIVKENAWWKINFKFKSTVKSWAARLV